MTESRKRAVLGSESLDFPSIAAGDTAELTFAASLDSKNARAGDAVALGPPANLPAGLMATAYVNSSDEIVVRLHNTTAGAIDPSAGAVAAQGTLTMDTQPSDGDTYTIGSKTYTFQTTLTDVDGNVNIGGTLAQAKLNLVAAIDLSGVAGTDYATSMTAHTEVSVAAFSGDDAVITALVAGESGNSIATTETFTAGTNVFDGATLGSTTLGVSAADALWSFALII